MTKTIEVLTQSGQRTYHIETTGKAYQVMHLQQTGHTESIGQARVRDDAMLIIRDHATSHYGGVRKVKIF